LAEAMLTVMVSVSDVQLPEAGVIGFSSAFFLPPAGREGAAV
jgi:hypothetical protein